MTKQEWLDELKPGDTVLVSKGGYGRENWEVSTVARRTPGGQILLTGGRRFNKEGFATGDADPWYKPWLTEPTPERMEVVERKRLVARIKSSELDGLPLEVLRDVVGRLDASVTSPPAVAGSTS